MMQDFDYLIAGQGIAGTSLAWQLHARGRKFLVIDSPRQPSSSLVAAGIFNPLTGRKLVKTWLADQLFPYALRFYGGIEKILETRFLHASDIYRPYRSPAEKNGYEARSEEYRSYLAETQADLSENRFVNAPFNGLTVTGSGWVDLPHFLGKSRNYFLEKGCFLEAHFSSEDLVSDNGAVSWNNMRFSKIIDCTGIGACSDPLFGWLPFNPVKGQILDCIVEGYDLEHIVNQGIFILPLGGGSVRVGATYSWHDLDWNTTPEALEYLTGKLSGLLKVPFAVERQQAGIRPSTIDRRPFAGRHPQHRRLYIFNGLGTKGVTLAPFFSEQLVNLLLEEQELLPDVNIERYFSLYSRLGMS